MDFWLYYLFSLLGLAVLYLIYRAIFRPPRGVFREPTDHVEIKSWRIKKP